VVRAPYSRSFCPAGLLQEVRDDCESGSNQGVRRSKVGGLGEGEARLEIELVKPSFQADDLQIIVALKKEANKAPEPTERTVL